MRLTSSSSDDPLSLQLRRALLQPSATIDAQHVVAIVAAVGDDRRPPLLSREGVLSQGGPPALPLPLPQAARTTTGPFQNCFQPSPRLIRKRIRDDGPPAGYMQAIEKLRKGVFARATEVGGAVEKR